MIGVYKITNPTGKVYVGSSKEVETRFKNYKRLKCKSQPKLYNSLVKYGVDNHTFELIEECDIESLFKRENYYGNIYNVLDRYKGLNLIIPGNEEVKYIISEENRLNRSIAQLGKKASNEVKLKMSKSQTGRRHSEETIEKMRLSNKRSRLVLNVETGIYYYNIVEAAISLNISKTYLTNMLSGYRKNITSFIYA